jgi:hypothetical protein
VEHALERVCLWAGFGPWLGLVRRCYRSIDSFISWLEGELEAEIESGFWNVYEPHAELLFRKDVDTLWTDVISKMPRKELFGVSTTESEAARCVSDPASCVRRYH